MKAAARILLRGLVELRLEFGRLVYGRFSLVNTHLTVLLSQHHPAAGPSLGGGYLASPCWRYYAPLRLPLGWLLPGPRRVSPVPCRTFPASHDPYAGGFLTAAPRSLGEPSSSPLRVPSGRAFAHSAQARLLFREALRPLPLSLTGDLNGAAVLRFTLRAAGLLAFLSEDLVSGPQRRGLPRRPRSATRRLGPYRDRTRSLSRKSKKRIHGEA